jgi:hypothetical protein
MFPNQKLCCLITGEIRSNTFEIIKSFSTKFDLVVWSTWEDQNVAHWDVVNLIIVRNQYPSNFGLGNRNLQRLSLNAGLKIAKDKHCTHILKWRTDLLIYNFDFKNLLNKYEERVYIQRSEMLFFTSYWRMLTVNPDWFSSFPDLIMFSRTEWMEIMWSDEGFNYDLGYNFPVDMVKELSINNIKNDSFEYKGESFSVPLNYDTHSELYAWFKFRIQNSLSSEFCHEKIVKNYFFLMNLEEMNVLWFCNSKKIKFRPLSNSHHFPWWNNDVFNGVLDVSVKEIGWGNTPQSKYDILRNWILIKSNILRQQLSFLFIRINLFNK